MALTKVIGSGIGSSATLVDGNLPAGSALQVVQVVKTDTFTVSGTDAAVGSEIALTGMTVNITPRSSSNKVLIFWNLNCGHNADTGHSYLFLMRGSTKIALGAAASNRTRATHVLNSNGVGEMSHMSGQFLDSPSTTSETTYSFKVASSTNQTVGFALNRTTRDNDAANFDGRAASTITVMEIAG